MSASPDSQAWGPQFVWGESAWWSGHSLYTSYCAATFFEALLTRHFLCMPERLPWADKALLAIAWTAACGPVNFYRQDVSALLCFRSDSQCDPGHGVVAGGCRSPLGRGSISFSGLVCALYQRACRECDGLRAVPRFAALENNILLGSALEMILLSAALANRINEERRQKEKAQATTLAILRASQALSAETRLDRLHARVREVMTALTGATGVHFVVWDADLKDWFLYEGAQGERRLAVAAAGRELLPLSALRHAQITQRALILDDALREDRFATDPAFAGADQCALMVLVILHHGTLCAVLVLENRKKRGAFSTVSSDSLASIAGPLACPWRTPCFTSGWSSAWPSRRVNCARPRNSSWPRHAARAGRRSRPTCCTTSATFSTA